MNPNFFHILYFTLIISLCQSCRFLSNPKQHLEIEIIQIETRNVLGLDTNYVFTLNGIELDGEIKEGVEVEAILGDSIFNIYIDMDYINPITISLDKNRIVREMDHSGKKELFDTIGNMIYRSDGIYTKYNIFNNFGKKTFTFIILDGLDTISSISYVPITEFIYQGTIDEKCCEESQTCPFDYEIIEYDKSNNIKERIEVIDASYLKNYKNIFPKESMIQWEVNQYSNNKIVYQPPKYWTDC